MDKQDFSRRLAQLRINKGVSARDMSLSLGQSASYINNIENGISLPSMTLFFYICEYLNITPSEFFDSDMQNPVKLNSIIKTLSKLDDRQLDTIYTLVTELSKK